MNKYVIDIIIDLFPVKIFRFISAWASGYDMIGLAPQTECEKKERKPTMIMIITRKIFAGGHIQSYHTFRMESLVPSPKKRKNTTTSLI